MHAGGEVVVPVAAGLGGVESGGASGTLRIAGPAAEIIDRASGEAGPPFIGDAPRCGGGEYFVFSKFIREAAAAEQGPVAAVGAGIKLIVGNAAIDSI